MLEPRIIEYHLSKIQKQIGENLTLPNTYFRLVKPTEENLKIYSNLAKKGRFSLFLGLLFAPLRISIEIFKSLGIAAIKSRESASFKVPEKVQFQRVFVSHYTHAQQPSRPDVFFNQLPSKNDLIFYHNNTLLSRTKIFQKLGQSSFRGNFLITTKSLGVWRTLQLQARNIRTALVMLKASTKRQNFSPLERKILIEASISQISRRTLANQINLIRLDSLLTQSMTTALVITLEGHAYESLYIDLIHSKYPGVQVLAYQHAPIVPDQFGLMKNLLKLNSRDVVLSSGEITRDFFNSLELNASVRLLGSPKWQPTLPISKRIYPTTVIGAAEGTVESLESFSQLFQKLANSDMDLKLVLRVHPALSTKETSRILSDLSFGENFILSNQTLEDDLRESHFCIYRSSAVAIEGLKKGVFPLYFNPSGDHGLNPLYFAKLEVPVFRNLVELEELFLNLYRIQSSTPWIQYTNLVEIGESYYSKFNPSALN